MVLKEMIFWHDTTQMPGKSCQPSQMWLWLVGESLGWQLPCSLPGEEPV
jgi:hypothetical protein